MTTYDCGFLRDRRAIKSGKWRKHPEDVLPMFVADMDLVPPQPVVDALQAAVAAGVFGYPEFNGEMADSPGLREAVGERMARKYGWHVAPEALLFVPGVGTGFNLAARTTALVSAQPGGELVAHTPLSSPI